MKNTWTIVKWFWETSKSLRAKTIVNAFLGILTIALDFAFIWATKLVIDIATGKTNLSLRLAACFLIAVIISQVAVGFTRKWVAALLGVKSLNRMQLKVFRRLLQSEWTGRESRHSGDVLNRIERDVNDVTNTITDVLPGALGVGFRIIGAFIFLYTMDAKLACIIAVVVPTFVFFSRIYVRKMRTITRQVRDTDSAIQSILQESIQHRMILKTLERTDLMVKKLGKAQAQLRKQVRHKTLYSSTSGAVLNSGFAIGYLVTFLWGAARLHDGSITYGMMLAFIQLVGQIQGPLREMTKFVPVLISALTSGERLMELEEVALEIEGKPIRFTEGAGIRVNNVTYFYEKKKRNILQDFSYDFPPGSTTAILGETGAGKTTLIRLILALLHPEQGSVEMYDNNGRRVEVSPLTRCNLVYVPQGNTIFSGTVRTNLLLGNPKATDEEMQEALRLACAEFILKMPDGLDSHCGEGGTGLSEGQAQRIAIARALLKHGSILLLDEATSALDSATERRLLQNLTQWMNNNQTLIFITHRPAVVDYCQQTLEMRKI